jgi:WD40 repeat protein
VGLCLFAGWEPHPIVVFRQDAETLGRGDGAAIGEPLRHEDVVKGAVYSPDGKRILSWSEDKTLRLWDVSWRGDNLFEIACNYAPIMGSDEMGRLSKRYGVRIDEPICQPGVKIPVPDWARTEPAHAE